TNLVGKKLPLFGAYLYSVEGNVTSDVASVEVTVGSEVFAADLENGEFTVGCAADGDFASATVKAKAADGTVLASVTVNF
ncbi:MAG: hypothetical protein ACYC21_09445, partial [Eubacteriales bacterium]